MAQHEMPASPERARQADLASPGDPTPPTRSSRWAISRGQLFMLLAVSLPAVASLMAPLLSSDISYQIWTGQLIVESGELVRTDPFTFTVLGEPWIVQPWLASVIFGAGFDATGWLGMMLLRAALIGLTFGLVYTACRAAGASQVVSSVATLGAFAVAATNLALRTQTFALVSFAAVVAILAWRRKHPLLLWLIPLIMIFWGNTHGSFMVGWAAVGVVALEDLLERSRLAPATITVGILSVLATLVHPWGLEMWGYVVDLSTNPLIPLLVSEWQPATLATATGLFFYASVAAVVALLLIGGRSISWLQIGWLAGLVLLGAMAARGVAWWALGAAPIAALLVSGLVVRRRRLDGELDRPRSPGYAVIALLAASLGLAVLPIWRPLDPLYGPEGIVQLAPRGVTEVLLAEATTSDNLYADQRWGSWFEQAVPGVPVMVDSRIELFDRDVWGDYLHVLDGRADWAEILDRWEVTLVAISADNDQLRPFIDEHPSWTRLFADAEGVLYRRLEGGA